MKSILLNGQTYSYEDIQKGNFPAHQALEFCSDWLNKKEVFTIHTSGSTGIPKPIEIQRKHMLVSAGMTSEALALKAGDSCLVCLNTEFIAGKMMLVRGLELGMSITIIPPSSNPLQQFPDTTHFDFAAFVPFQLETIFKETPEKKNILDTMKAVIIGGAAINPELEEKIQSIKAPVYHTFGMTETLSHIALRRMNGIERSEYFKILNSVSIALDSRACLIVTSPLSDHPVITNDIVEIMDNTHFKWVGRIDTIINSGGLKIYPEKTERAIGKIFINLNLDKRFFLAGFPHAELGESLGLVIEDEPWNEERIERVKNEMKNHVSRYEVPKYFYFRNPFLETASGKIDKVSMKLEIIH